MKHENKIPRMFCRGSYFIYVVCYLFMYTGVQKRIPISDDVRVL